MTPTICRDCQSMVTIHHLAANWTCGFDCPHAIKFLYLWRFSRDKCSSIMDTYHCLPTPVVYVQFIHLVMCSNIAHVPSLVNKVKTNLTCTFRTWLVVHVTVPCRNWRLFHYGKKKKEITRNTHAHLCLVPVHARHAGTGETCYVCCRLA